MRNTITKGARDHECFNEAAAIQLRMPDLIADRALMLITASMRPQRFSCGCRKFVEGHTNDEIASMRPQRFSCGCLARECDFREFVNASMRPQRFSCGCSRASLREMESPCGFNEAAAIQLRMLPEKVRQACNVSLLQ